MLKSFFKATAITTMITIFCLLFSFIIVNLMLGCESWNREMWTLYNSCVTPTEFLGIK